MARILVTSRMGADTMEKLRSAGHELAVCDAADWREKLEAARGFDALAVRGGNFPREFFEGLPDLKVLALPSAGFEGVDIAASREFGVVVTNASGGNAETVAEHALMLMLSASKMLGRSERVIRGEIPWREKNQMTFTELYGKTVSLLGWGRIASKLARICALGLNMRVIAYHPSIDKKEVPDYAEKCSDMEYALREADVVSCHIPARESNWHIIGKRELEMMKPTAVFVNTGRGSVVDEKALTEALQNGTIACAGLDVFEEEPSPKDNPLFHMDNCVCTPHIGGETREAKHMVYEMAAENVLCVLSGREAPNRVN